MEDDEMKLQNAQAQRRMSKATKCQVARNIANEQAKHMRMMANTKPLEVHILVGLPGSGKTTFAYQIKDEHKCYTHIIDADSWFAQSEGIENYINDFFKREGYEISRETCSTFACGEQIIFDGLMLTNEDVQKISSLFVNHISQLKWNDKPIPAKFFIHQWNEDRESCLKNDVIRLETGEYNRTEAATATIEYAKYEVIDMDALRQMFPDYEFNYVEHNVVAHSQKELILENYGDDGVIRSDRWCVGGDVCNCWGSHWIIDNEDDPAEFTSFINIVNHFCPNISHDDYRKLWDACVDTDCDAEADYYGGCLHYRWYICNLEQLFNKMEEMGVIEVK